MQTELIRRVPTHVPGVGAREFTPRALTATSHVFTIHARFEGWENERILAVEPVDESALIAWQDVLDMVVNGRPNEVGCPYCNHRPLTIEEVEHSTKISCSKCGKFIQGRFA
ncbi:MAG TPA: hypothetical protein VFQ53_11635 [Kofleriaceae bacterium]|nr:hypothetical protein [Kofleriaceae bacterium]